MRTIFTNRECLYDKYTDGPIISALNPRTRVVCKNISFYMHECERRTQVRTSDFLIRY